MKLFFRSFLNDRGLTLSKPLYYIYYDYIEWLGIDTYKDLTRETFNDISYKVLKEPLKFIKNPIWSDIALQTLKEPLLVILVMHYYGKSKKSNKSFYKCFKISKDSIQEISNESFITFIEDYKKELKKKIP